MRGNAAGPTTPTRAQPSGYQASNTSVCFRAHLPLAGGIREQLWVCKPGEDVTVIGDRKGFVKLALETGSALVPVYIFNERKAFVINR